MEGGDCKLNSNIILYCNQSPPCEETSYVKAARDNLSIEEFLAMSMSNYKDKLILLTFEQELLSFLNTNNNIVSFPGLTSYNRFLLHKLANYFLLDHIFDISGNSIVISKNENSKIPVLNLNDLSVIYIKTDSYPIKKILKRNISKPEEQNEEKKEISIKTLEQREEEYNMARERIFKDLECQIEGDLDIAEGEKIELLNEVQKRKDSYMNFELENEMLNKNMDVSNFQGDPIDLNGNIKNKSLTQLLETLKVSDEDCIQMSLDEIQKTNNKPFIKINDFKKPIRESKNLNQIVFSPYSRNVSAINLVSNSNINLIGTTKASFVNNNTNLYAQQLSIPSLLNFQFNCMPHNYSQTSLPHYNEVRMINFQPVPHSLPRHHIIYPQTRFICSSNNHLNDQVNWFGKTCNLNANHNNNGLPLQPFVHLPFHNATKNFLRAPPIPPFQLANVPQPFISAPPPPSILGPGPSFIPPTPFTRAFLHLQTPVTPRVFVPKPPILPPTGQNKFQAPNANKFIHLTTPNNILDACSKVTNNTKVGVNKKNRQVIDFPISLPPYQTIKNKRNQTKSSETNKKTINQNNNNVDSLDCSGEKK